MSRVKPLCQHSLTVSVPFVSERDIISQIIISYHNYRKYTIREAG